MLYAVRKPNRSVVPSKDRYPLRRRVDILFDGEIADRPGELVETRSILGSQLRQRISVRNVEAMLCCQLLGVRFEFGVEWIQTEIDGLAVENLFRTQRVRWNADYSLGVGIVITSELLIEVAEELLELRFRERCDGRPNGVNSFRMPLRIDGVVVSLEIDVILGVAACLVDVLVFLVRALARIVRIAVLCMVGYFTIVEHRDFMNCTVVIGYIHGYPFFILIDYF